MMRSLQPYSPSTRSTRRTRRPRAKWLGRCSSARPRTAKKVRAQPPWTYSTKPRSRPRRPFSPAQALLRARPRQASSWSALTGCSDRHQRRCSMRSKMPLHRSKS
eukprot:Amastigsp_a340737_50.p4 type:complete len:105 gc:universal Amastigsp_a340737_50:403-717(+)